MAKIRGFGFPPFPLLTAGRSKPDGTAPGRFIRLSGIRRGKGLFFCGKNA